MNGGSRNFTIALEDFSFPTISQSINLFLLFPWNKNSLLIYLFRKRTSCSLSWYLWLVSCLVVELVSSPIIYFSLSIISFFLALKKVFFHWSCLEISWTGGAEISQLPLKNFLFLLSLPHYLLISFFLALKKVFFHLIHLFSSHAFFLGIYVSCMVVELVQRRAETSKLLFCSSPIIAFSLSINLFLLGPWRRKHFSLDSSFRKNGPLTLPFLVSISYSLSLFQKIKITFNLSLSISISISISLSLSLFPSVSFSFYLFPFSLSLFLSLCVSLSGKNFLNIRLGIVWHYCLRQSRKQKNWHNN